MSDWREIPKEEREELLKALKEGKFEIAEQAEIEKCNQELLERFMVEVMDTERYLLTDDSALFDFSAEDESEYIEKAKKIFNVDITEVKDEPMFAIINFLEQHANNL